MLTITPAPHSSRPSAGTKYLGHWLFRTASFWHHSECPTRFYGILIYFEYGAYIREWTGSSIGSHNGMWTVRHQAIIWTNADELSIGLSGTNVSEIWFKIYTFSFKKMRLIIVERRPFCSSLGVLTFITGGNVCGWPGQEVQIWVIIVCKDEHLQGVMKQSVDSIMSLMPWGLDKFAAISQTTFSNPFSWMKIYEFHLRFDWSLFLRFELTIYQHWFR